VPTYEYACQSCGHHVEVYQRFSDPPLSRCEVCGGPLRKVFHPAGILFKGSGFYATDSRRAASKSSADSGEGGASGSSDSGSSARKAGSDGSGGSKGGGKPSSDGSRRSDRAASPTKERSA